MILSLRVLAEELKVRSYELVYVATIVVPYLLSLTPENNLDSSFDAFEADEQLLLQPLLSVPTDPKQYN